jgi:hypothetical protein
MPTSRESPAVNISSGREDAMKQLFLVAVIATALDGANAAAAELPIYELMGFPITPHQLVVVGPANVQEQAPFATLTLAGMPASAHQIAVLTPRQRPIEHTASSGERIAVGLARSSHGIVTEQVR